MVIVFIGLGNVGASLASTLLRNGCELIVRDLDRTRAERLLAAGARWAESPAALMEQADFAITCLPNPAASARVLEDDDGILSVMRRGKTWIEMSTTDTSEVTRLGTLVESAGGAAADCPVSGGCHRATTGNIAVFAGCSRTTFENILPILTILGRDVLHTGDLGTSSSLKVVTNYLATAHLVALAEALTVTSAAGLNLATAFDAIRISSGNSFVHETEGQVILNGSRDVGFTMDLVQKDITLFQSLADRAGINLELSPLLIDIFKDGAHRYGGGEWSTNIIRRLEDDHNVSVNAGGFPASLTDLEPEVPGREIKPRQG